MTKKDFEMLAQKSWNDTLHDLSWNFKIQIDKAVENIGIRYSWRLWIAKQLLKLMGRILKCRIIIDIEYIEAEK